jgi:hypothetical protein
MDFAFGSIPGLVCSGRIQTGAHASQGRAAHSRRISAAAADACTGAPFGGGGYGTIKWG